MCVEIEDLVEPYGA